MTRKEPVFKKPSNNIFFMENFYLFLLALAEPKPMKVQWLQIGLKLFNFKLSIYYSSRINWWTESDSSWSLDTHRDSRVFNGRSTGSCRHGNPPWRHISGRSTTGLLSFTRFLWFTLSAMFFSVSTYGLYVNRKL